ncbi:hypothetical protein [Thiomonas sp.]
MRKEEAVMSPKEFLARMDSMSPEEVDEVLDDLIARYAINRPTGLNARAEAEAEKPLRIAYG